MLALAGYVSLSLLFSWPLPLHLATRFTGPVGGDTGAYVWNQWVFRHELLDVHSLPLFTHEIFSTGRAANLSLHNYTIFQDLLAVPLIPLFGVVVTFNLIYLLMVVLTAFTMFLLAHHLTMRAWESWLAGALFAWSPELVTRSLGHFSLVAAAPLPLFILLLMRTDRPTWRQGLALGLTTCWAATTDPYYAVYCVMIAVVYLAVRTVRLTARETRPDAVRHAIDVLLVCLSGIIVALALTHGWEINLFGIRLSMHSLYTPVLSLTVLALLRLAWPYRRVIVSIDRTQALRLLRLASATGLVAAILLSPVLYAVGVRIHDAGFESGSILWRSSAPGIDALTWVLPNPNHVLTPSGVRAFLTPREDVYLENVASLTFVAIAVIALALRKGWRPPVFWSSLTIAFGLLSLGPFVHVAGFNTHLPGPWALARYLPLVRLARNPARLAVVLMLGVAALFGMALACLGEGDAVRRRRRLAVVTAVLLFELCPAPRPLYSAEVPAFYQQLADDTRDVTVLELPTGVRDGTQSVGDFTARSEYYQTVHGKPLLGGYLSRVSQRRIEDARRDALFDALMTLSEGKPIAFDHEQRLLDEAPAFLARTRIGYVVIDRLRTSLPLQRFAVRAFHLRQVASDGPLDLYVPAVL